MASSLVRRPLPALVSLVALLLLTGIVWWRVVNRDTTAPTPRAGCSSSAPAPARSAGPSGSGSATASAALPAPSAVTLQVVNSSDRSGIAAAARTRLQAAGFSVPDRASNDQSATRDTNTGVAQIRYGPSARSAAALVQLYLPGATLVDSGATTSTVVVALGPKYTAVASDAAVKAARAGAAAGPSGSSSPTAKPSPAC